MRPAWHWTALALGLVAVGSYGAFLYLRPAPLPDQLLYGNGHVEGTEVSVAAEISGRVVESHLIEGAKVSHADMLVRIDDSDIQLHRERAGAEVKALQSERGRAERELGVWQHHLRTAETDLARYRELRAGGTVPPQRLEQAQNAFQEALGRVGAIEAELSAFDSRIEAARKELAIVENQLGRTRIVAPIDGTILAKGVEGGEYVQPGRVVAVLVDLSRLDLKLFIPEKDLGKVRLSGAARVRVDAYPGRFFEARVKRIDQRAQFTPRDVHMPEERVRTVFGVTLALENPEGILKPGMPADAWLLWRPEAGWPQRLVVPQ